MALNIKQKKTKSIVIITDEIGRYCYTEIPIAAFMFNDEVDWKFEDKNADRMDELIEEAQINEN